MVKSLVNLKKPTLKAVKTSMGTYVLQFLVDCNSECEVRVYFDAVESDGT